MSSVQSAMRQLSRHVEYTKRYLMDQAANNRLEAEDGLADDPEWHLSGDAMQSAVIYGTLLGEALSRAEKLANRATTKEALKRQVKVELERLRKRVATEERDEGFHALSSASYALSEVFEVLVLVLKGRMYVPGRYEQWNNWRCNRWYTHPYIRDEGMPFGEVYRLSRVSRLVLSRESLQVRWMTGRVLLEIPYVAITRLVPEWRKGQEYWRFFWGDSEESTIDVSQVWNLGDLRNALRAKCPNLN